MQRENNRTKLLTRRAVLLGGAQVALLATLAGRMYYLQVMQADRYVMLADENRISIRLVAPPRGRIVDRFGVPLADNQPTYRIVLVAEQAGDIDCDAQRRRHPHPDQRRRPPPRRCATCSASTASCR